MVLLAASEEEQLVRSIADQRAKVARKTRDWRPYSQTKPLEQWQAFAGELSSMSIDFERDAEALRRKQRLRWRSEEQSTLRESLDLHVLVSKSLIAFRAEERQERIDDLRGAVPLETALARNEGSFEYGRRVARRQQRAGEERWPARPSTAPSSRDRARQQQQRQQPIVRGRPPADDSSVWFSGRGGSIALSGVAPPLGKSRGVRPGVVRQVLQPGPSMTRIAWM